MKKKILVVVLMLGLVSTSIHGEAAELVNSIGSDATDITKGKDITQGKVTEYYPDVTINSTTYDAESQVSVFVTKGSMIKIRAPKTLILNVSEPDPVTFLSDATGSYQLGICADLSGTQKLSVVFPSTITFTNKLKTCVGQISMIKGDWIWSDLNPTSYTYSTSNINIHGLTAGTWQSAFNIKYVLTNDQN